ncbi:ankyrin, partial [Aspergillus campestris IBT 28561]
MNKDTASNFQVTKIISQLKALSSIAANPNDHVTVDSCRRAISVATTLHNGREWVLKSLTATNSDSEAFFILKGDFLMVVAAWLGLTTVCMDNSNYKKVAESHGLLGNALYAAAYDDDEPLARFMIDNGADPCQKEGAYGDALQLAAYRGSEKVARLLLNTDKLQNRNLGPYGLFGSSLQAAATLGHKGIVQLLLPQKNANLKIRHQWQRSPLHIAAQNGHADVVGLLLETRTFDPSVTDRFGDTPLSTAVREGHEAVVQILLECDSVYSRGKRQTRLQTFISKGHSEIVENLLSLSGFYVYPTHIRQPSPTVLAAWMKHVDVLELLLERDGVYIRGFSRARLLRWAALTGMTRIAKLLLELHQTDPNSRSTGEVGTPLHLAAEHNHFGVVRILLEHRDTNPNRQDWEGKTPLMTATEGNHAETARLLLSDGRTVHDIQDRHGMTPLMHAISNGYSDITQLIIA